MNPYSVAYNSIYWIDLLLLMKRFYDIEGLFLLYYQLISHTKSLQGYRIQIHTYPSHLCMRIWINVSKVEVVFFLTLKIKKKTNRLSELNMTCFYIIYSTGEFLFIVILIGILVFRLVHWFHLNEIGFRWNFKDLTRCESLLKTTNRLYLFIFYWISAINFIFGFLFVFLFLFALFVASWICIWALWTIANLHISYPFEIKS